MKAYEEMIRNTSTKKSPWYVVPADNKSFARIVIASAVINALDDLGLEYPRVSKEKIAELQAIKKHFWMKNRKWVSHRIYNSIHRIICV